MPTRREVDEAAEKASQSVYPNFERLRTPFEIGFAHGAEWAAKTAKEAAS